jgi:hypothetical protein
VLTLDALLSMEREALEEEAHGLEVQDLTALVEWLSSQEDEIRYRSFLLLKFRSQHDRCVYQFWEAFRSRLSSGNSYQRSLGMMLLSENVRWDEENRMGLLIDEYLRLLGDEKPITVRQCIQSLENILLYKPELSRIISERLVALPLEKIRETMRKSILMDILQILIPMRRYVQDPEIDRFINQALTGDILDKKAKKQLEALL